MITSAEVSVRIIEYQASPEMQRRIDVINIAAHAYNLRLAELTEHQLLSVVLQRLCGPMGKMDDPVKELLPVYGKIIGVSGEGIVTDEPWLLNNGRRHRAWVRSE